MMIWFQRLTAIFGDISSEFLTSELVSKIKDPHYSKMFSTDWLRTGCQGSFDEGPIKDKNKYNKMSKKIYITEFNDFNHYSF